MAWSTHSHRAVPNDWPKRKALVLARDAHHCYLCAGPANEVDHILNVAAGGTHEPNNLAAICTPCHKQKTQAEAAAGRPQQRRQPEKHPGLR